METLVIVLVYGLLFSGLLGLTGVLVAGVGFIRARVY